MFKTNLLKTFYFDIPNVGDQLTKILLKKIWNIDIIFTHPLACDMVGIGSILESMCISNRTMKSRVKSELKKILGVKSPCYIWSSGFMCMDGIKPEKFYRKNLVFTAVRGNMSKKIIEEMYAPIPNVILADGGLLSSKIIDKVQKKFDIGVIPHMDEMANVHILELMDVLTNKYKNIKLIDVRKTPIEVINDISNCETVLSSSLHGLIIADSFGIPNQHIIVSDLIGKSQKFKYDDYYSSYNLPHIEINVANNKNNLSKNYIEDNYKINYTDILQKQNLLIKTFPFQI